MQSFTMNIYHIQPSQLYISEEKLKEIENILDFTNVEDIEPLPIKRIGNSTFFTDGHTRAFALYKKGVREIKVYWDEDCLDWIQYLICLNWCDEEGITNISDLEDRIINEEDYQELWLNRWKKMYDTFEKNFNYYIDVKEEINPNAKSKICDIVLRSLPDWFGIEESILEYVDGVKESYFLAAYVGNIPIGFISVIEHNKFTSEVYVLGVLPEFHKKGIGRAIILKAQNHLFGNNRKFLTVKTLSDSHPDKHYKETREFYKSMGFYPIEEFKTLWGEANPCLLMLKCL